MKRTYQIGTHSLTLREKVTPEHLATVKRMMGIESFSKLFSDAASQGAVAAFCLDLQCNESQFNELIRNITGYEGTIALSEIDDSRVIGRMISDFFGLYGLSS